MTTSERTGEPATSTVQAERVAPRIRAVGERLATSFRGVLDALPGPSRRPNQLAQLLGLNRDISGRVLAATRARDPLAVAHAIPGPEPLRKLLRAAGERQVEASLIADAGEAVDQFERLIREVAGDRPALDAIIGSLSPGPRRRFEMSARQTIFKGTSLLKGVMADTWLHAALVHPSADDQDHHDVAHLYGTLGVRRVRPDARVKFTYRQFGTPERPCRTLGGAPAEAADGAELDRFCTLAPAPLEETATPGGVLHALGGGVVGPESACDKLLAEVRPRAMARRAGEGPRRRKSLFVAPSIPVKMLLFDMLLHDEAFPGAEPCLLVYDTTVEGMASVNDPARDADRMEVSETVTVLGRGPERFEALELPRYAELLEYAAGRLGWDLRRFRGYRCRIPYPMYGAQACLAFDAPP